MRLAYLGTPGVAVAPLVALHDAGHDIVVVVTGPDRRRGRGTATSPSPVKAAAVARGLPFTHDLGELSGNDAELGVVVAYGRIIPSPLLDEIPMVNLHFSLLPRWRGAAPIQRAILAGDSETGVTIMDMEAGLDTGPMRLATSVEIGSKTAGQLTHELAHLGAAMMSDVLAETDRYPPFAQPAEGVTHAAKIDKAEARLDFSGSSKLVARQVSAFNPAPGAYFEFRGERIKVLEAMEARAEGDVPGAVLDDRLLVACWAGSIRPISLQRAGRAAMGVEEFLRGFPISAGTRLG